MEARETRLAEWQAIKALVGLSHTFQIIPVMGKDGTPVLDETGGWVIDEVKYFDKPNQRKKRKQEWASYRQAHLLEQDTYYMEQGWLLLARLRSGDITNALFRDYMDRMKETAINRQMKGIKEYEENIGVPTDAKFAEHRRSRAA